MYINTPDKTFSMRNTGGRHAMLCYDAIGDFSVLPQLHIRTFPQQQCILSLACYSLERLAWCSDARDCVFFMHGILDTSMGWVSNGVTGSQAFAAYDQGFDVWLGNSRSNPPRVHIGTSPSPFTSHHITSPPDCSRNFAKTSSNSQLATIGTIGANA